jgi:S1-C subfamily serine protease
VNAFKSRAFALVLGILLLQGCASIVSGTNQVVSVDTPGCPASACELTNDKGKWYVSTTPGTTTVSRAYGSLTAVCKNGDVTATASFNSTTKGMAFGNILFGGVIGAGVDMSSGAAYDYPNTMSVPMVCAPKAETVAVARMADAPRRARLGIKVDNLTAATAAAAGLATTEGVMVTEVDEAGAGKLLGFKVGHIVQEVNGRKVANFDALSAEVGNAEEGDMEFTVIQAGTRMKLGRRKGAL